MRKMCSLIYPTQKIAYVISVSGSEFASVIWYQVTDSEYEKEPVSDISCYTQNDNFCTLL